MAAADSPSTTQPITSAAPSTDTNAIDWYLVLTSPLDTPEKIQEVTNSTTEPDLEIRVPPPTSYGPRTPAPADPTAPRRCVRLPPDGEAKIIQWHQRHRAIYNPIFFSLPRSARPPAPVLADLPPPRQASPRPAQSSTEETSQDPATQQTQTAYLRPAKDILDRLRWDPAYTTATTGSEWIVVYEDRFLGAQEIALSAWESEVSEEEFIPLHRVLSVKRKQDGLVVWEREGRVDLVFGTGKSGKGGK